MRPASSNLASALRVALVYHDRIVDERVVGAGRAVTVGDGLDATFAVVPAGLSRTQPLLRPTADGWLLRCTTETQGCISLQGRRRALSALFATGHDAAIAGPRERVLGADAEHEVEARVRDVLLTTGDWGVVACGDARIVFQCTRVGQRRRRRWFARAWYGRAPALIWATLASLAVQGGLLGAALRTEPTESAWASARASEERRVEYVTSAVDERREAARGPTARSQPRTRAAGPADPERAGPDPIAPRSRGRALERAPQGASNRWRLQGDRKMQPSTNPERGEVPGSRRGAPGSLGERAP